MMTHYINVGGNNEGGKDCTKRLVGQITYKKKIIFEWREKQIIEKYISINLRMAGWNMGVSGLGPCLMSRPAIAGVAWSMISCRVRGFNATVNSQNFMTEA
jgi:hypothetical protein